MTFACLGSVVAIVVENGTEPVVKCGLPSCDLSCPHLEAYDHRSMLRDPRDRRQTVIFWVIPKNQEQIHQNNNSGIQKELRF